PCCRCASGNGGSETRMRRFALRSGRVAQRFIVRSCDLGASLGAGISRVARGARPVRLGDAPPAARAAGQHGCRDDVELGAAGGHLVEVARVAAELKDVGHGISPLVSDFLGMTWLAPALTLRG